MTPKPWRYEYVADADGRNFGYIVGANEETVADSVWEDDAIKIIAAVNDCPPQSKTRMKSS